MATNDTTFKDITDDTILWQVRRIARVVAEMLAAGEKEPVIRLIGEIAENEAAKVYQPLPGGRYKRWEHVERLRQALACGVGVAKRML